MHSARGYVRCRILCVPPWLAPTALRVRLRISPQLLPPLGLDRLQPIPTENSMSHFLSISPKALACVAVADAQPVDPPSEDAGAVFEFDRIPVDEVHLDVANRIVLYTDPQGLAADRFRFLRLRLRERAQTAKLKTILVTSPLPQDGKSTVALNLATALSEHGARKVLLLEADLYHATIAGNLGLPARAGLATCLEKGLDPMSAIRRLEPLSWYLLPGGEAHDNPTELLHSDRFSTIMETLSPHFDWIIIDSPPITPVTDALSLMRHADAALLVVRAGSTPQASVKAACALLGPKNIIGIVLNGVEGLNRLYSKYYGRYGKAPNTGV